jgi:hypothetical protein
MYIYHYTSQTEFHTPKPKYYDAAVSMPKIAAAAALFSN